MYTMQNKGDDGILLFMSLILCAILPIDSTRYYVTFLGRNVTSTTVGVFLQQLTGKAPDIIHDVDSCTYSDSNWGISSNFTASEFDGPGCGEIIPNSTEIRKKGIIVESVDDFTLHVIQTDSSGFLSDGFIAIPEEHLGSTYYIISYCATGGLCQFSVLATKNNTKVKLTFPNSVQPRAVCISGNPVESNASPGTAIPFELNELDVLHFESEHDLSGTYISADKDIAVFAGGRDIPNKHGTTSNVIEQMSPLKKWGTEFVVVPNYLNDAGDIVKIVTQRDNTVIYILGFSPITIPNAGVPKDFRIDWQMHSSIHASEPVLLMQIMNLNLYNSSNGNIPSGSPAMVTVPHREQWVDTEHHFHCVVSSATNESLIAVVYEPGNVVSLVPTPSVHFSQWDVIPGSEYEVMIAKPSARETSVSGGKRSMYGFCEGQYAILLGVNWDWENEACQTTISSPGDDVDNDCDGIIDEDNCTDADLSFSFVASQSSSGNVTYKAINVRNAGHVDFTVTTCDIAVFTLKTNSYPQAYITIKISPTSIIEQICVPECFDAATENNSVSDCLNDEQHYQIEWFEDNVGLKHVFHTSTTDYFWDIDNAFGVDYEELVLSAVAGSATFVVELPDKDCGKIISETADTAGRKFLVPVSNSDFDFSIVLTTQNDLTTPVSVELNVENSKGVITMNQSETRTITKGDVTEAVYNSITISCESGEILVFLMRHPTIDFVQGLTILPSDILGPSYLLFIDSNINKNDSTAVICEATATDRVTVSNNDDIIDRDTPTPITNGMYADGKSSLGVKHLLADRPIAVFCGTFTDTLVQIPPKETLGTEFYIPKLDLDLINAVAAIHVVITEDSTVLVIGGNYDQMDAVHYAGDIYIRAVQPNTIYSITSSKTVQVHLEMRSTVDGWASAVVIPPTKHYKNSHVFPGHSGSVFQLSFSSAVDQNGLEVTSLVTASVLTGMASSTLTYPGGPTFSISVLNFISSYPGKKIVIPADFLYTDTNEICKVSKGSPGDGIDNDCDGLIDEEYCSDSKEPGTFDYDIDGSLDEDCSASSNATSSSKEIVIPLSLLSCTTSSNNTVTSNTLVTIVSGAITGTIPTIFPTIPSSGTEATYDPIISNTAGGISLPTTTPASGNTSVTPVDTCVTECVCPCGWVNPPQNYTAEELEEIVEEIQEKLKVNKAKLSSTGEAPPKPNLVPPTRIRKKTSAPDDRPSATAVGYVGLASIIFTLGAMALLDITTIFRDIRKKTSAPDDRPSATAVGYVGLASIIFTLGAMALLDITTIFRDVRVMLRNLREVFQE